MGWSMVASMRIMISSHLADMSSCMWARRLGFRLGRAGGQA